MGSVVIKIVGRADRIPNLADGEWLMDFDNEFDGGRGSIQTTSDIHQAKKFENVAEALRTWKQQSVTNPIRPDGEFNRPLTAFTVEINAYNHI